MKTREAFKRAVNAGHNRILMHNDLVDVLLIINVDTPDDESLRGAGNGEWQKIGTTFNSMKALLGSNSMAYMVVVDSWVE